MQVQLKQIVVPPGQQLLMTDVSWSMYEQLLEEFGENRGARINYSQGVLGSISAEEKMSKPRPQGFSKTLGSESHPFPFN